MESSSKRAKALGSVGQVAHCLVDGCSADLSVCRDYHRRHKVCEAHSKTPKVTIGGREQRFCQQCSRFHSLVEFDEGKRSCRKRLDGHNRRRRKPQPDSLPRPISAPHIEMLNYSSYYKGVGVNQLQLVQGMCQPFLHPKMFCDDSGLNQVVNSDGALSLLSSPSPSPASREQLQLQLPFVNNMDYSGVEQYHLGHQGKPTPSPAAASAATFHFPDMFQHAPEGSSHQTLSFMWD